MDDQIDDEITQPILVFEESALNGMYRCYTLDLKEENYLDVQVLAKDAGLELNKLHEIVQQELRSYKFQIRIKVIFSKIVDETVKVEAFFNSKQRCMYRHSNFRDEASNCFMELELKLQDFVQRDSGLVTEQISELRLCVSKLQVARIGCRNVHIPSRLRASRSIVHLIGVPDGQCFLYSVLCALFRRDVKHHSNKAYSYKKFLPLLNYDVSDFPITFSEIPRYERSNNMSVFVNAYDPQKGGIFPVYRSATVKEKHVNLLFIHGDSEDAHFFPIMNLDSFMGIINNKHHGRKYYCCKCLLPLYTASRLSEHMIRCGELKQKIIMPQKTDDGMPPTAKFDHFDRKLFNGMVCYADFECLLIPTENKGTANTQTHYPWSHCIVPCERKCEHVADNVLPPVLHRGENTVTKFLQSLIDIGVKLQRKPKVPLMISNAQRDHLLKVPDSVCHICGKAIMWCANCHVLGEYCTTCMPHVDHCAGCGKIRSLTHRRCNMNMRVSRDVVCVIHNTMRYDNHLIWKELYKLCKTREVEYPISVIAKSGEKYVAFRIEIDSFPETRWGIKFIDSCNFLSAPLDTLTRNLAEQGIDRFVALKQNFSDLDTLQLFLRKGIFPYDYVDSSTKLDLTCLPEKHFFYNKLNEKDITDEEYEHARKVWQACSIKNLGEYSDVYLLVDTLQLANVFQSFRRFIHEKYYLDVTHYVSLPSFTLDAALLNCGIEVELISDIDQYLFLEEGLRGGLNGIHHRYAKANHPGCPDYDSSKEHADPADFNESVIRQLNADDDVGYIISCDLEYPHYLHDKHNAFPLAPVKRKVEGKELSSQYKEISEKLGLGRDTTMKLVMDLNDKEDYVVHLKTLQKYLELGLKIKQVNRVLKFHQSAWLKSYAEFNTELRNKARNSFEKSIYKYLVNSLFGKLLQNPRKFLDLRPCSSTLRFQKLARKDNYKKTDIIQENLVICHMQKTTAKLNQLIHCGFTVLDLGKIAMYDFFYNHLQIRFSPKNEKQLGFFKFEHPLAGCIVEFVGLRPKMYSIIFANDAAICKAKGIGRSHLKSLKHQDYKRALFDVTSRTGAWTQFRSKHHQLETIRVVKRTLNPGDTKRYITDNGIATFAYGHCAISAAI